MSINNISIPKPKKELGSQPSQINGKVPPKPSSLLFCSHIRCSDQSSYFESQWSHYLDQQQGHSLTDLSMHLKDGVISLHQAVLLPLSPLLSLCSSKEMSTPLVLELPDYHLSTALSLVSLLYTGSCLPESTASYFSILSMVSSLGLNLSPSSFVLCDAKSSGYHHKKFRSIMTTNEDISENISSLNRDVIEEERNDIDREGVGFDECLENPNLSKSHRRRSNSESEAKTSQAGVCSQCEAVPCACIAKVDSKELTFLNKTCPDNLIQQKTSLKIKTPKFNIKFRESVKTSKLLDQSKDNSSSRIGNSCPVCGLYVGGGIFKYRSHLVDKHFYKHLSSLLGKKINQCPVCEKTFGMRSNLVKHYGVLHKYVDQLVKDDVNQNSSQLFDTSSKSIQNIEDSSKLVIDEEELKGNTLAASPSTHKFPCTLCPSIRKTQFRLLQHYCVSHYRSKLEDQFGLQFVTSNGSCPVCWKSMKNLYSFLMHMGAGHGEVSLYLTQEPASQEANNNTKLENTWICPSEQCIKTSFHNKCSLMKHFTLKHHIQELTVVLQPQFADGGNCPQCGKHFSVYNQFLIHCSITHRLVLSHCTQAELASLQIVETIPVVKGSGGVKRKERQGDRLFPCKLCNDKFFNNYLLMRHYTAKHFYSSLCADFAASMSTGKCELCGEIYPGWRMAQHLGVTHEEVVKYLAKESQ